MTRSHGDEEREIPRERGWGRRAPTSAHEQPLRSIIEQLPDGIVIVDSEGDIRFANPAAEQLFARTTRTLSGTPFGFPVTNDAPPEIDIIRPGADAVTAELRVVEISWDGEPARLVALRDVTDRKRAEERARLIERERVARIEAEAANRAKSEFLATMSHELRTPLNAVIGYAQLLDLGIGGALTPEHRQHVGRILVTSRHLLGLVSEVLDLSKVDAGRLAMHIAATSSRAVVDAAAALVQPLAEPRAVSFEVRRIDGGDAHFAGDEDRVRQILVNLLSNAVKFTDAGGLVSLEYGLTTRSDPKAQTTGSGPWAFFRVTDTGIGIPDDQLSRIFEPFVQVKSGRTRANDGSGLGLAISHKLARLMGGDITVESRLGEGSAFTLWLPAASAESAAIVPRAAAAEPSLGDHRGLSSVGETLLNELSPLVSTVAGRVRVECSPRRASNLKYSQLADHFGAYLADLAGVLIALDESDGEPSNVLIDAMEIHRLVAGRHGTQRARLGWTEDAISREYQILREEIDRVVRSRTTGAGAPIDGAMPVLGRLLEEAERTSLRAFARATGEP
jgi:signal transduction histidine kinase